MLLQKKFLDGIRNGSVTLAFRRWRRPSVRQGGSLMTAAGELQIGSISQVTLESISTADARQAGYESREVLLAELTRREEGEFYGIELGRLLPDSRIALRDSPAMGEELDKLRKQLQRMDARSSGPAWTQRVLELVGAHVGVRAGDLCALVDQDKVPFKRNVRKLKNLGLTESLEVGYRLSPRAEALLNGLRGENEG